MDEHFLENEPSKRNINALRLQHLNELGQGR